MDAFVLARLAAELGEHWKGAWIQGVWEDREARLVLRLRHRGRSGHLLCSPRAAAPGIGVVDRRTPCPPRPTALPAYLRAHGRGKLMAASCPPFERVLRLVLGSPGKAVTVCLEAIPGKEALYALDGEGVVRAVGSGGGGRFSPGDSHTPPEPPPGQRLPNHLTSEEVTRCLESGEPLHRLALGIGPVLAREVAQRAREADVARIWSDLLAEYGTCGPLWWYPDDTLSTVELRHRTDSPRRCSEPLRCAGEWLLQAAARHDRQDAESDRAQVEKRFRKKLRRRLAKIRADLEGLDDPESVRRRADALAAGLWQVPSGADTVRVADPGDPTTGYEIELDPALTAGQNLDRLYTRVRKLERTREALRERLAQSERELEAGPPEASAAKGEGTGTGTRQGPYRRYRSSDGWSIWVGRNAGENDRLLREARPWDLWLHARDAAGAHVVVRKPGREARVPERTLWEAAGIAAQSSRRQQEDKVEVMVAERDRVRKPKGAGPGRVVVAGERTLYVKPGAGRASPETE